MGIRTNASNLVSVLSVKMVAAPLHSVGFETRRYGAEQSGGQPSADFSHNPEMA